MSLTGEERKVLLRLHAAMEKTVVEVEPRCDMRSSSGKFLMTRDDLSDFVRRCFMVGLEEM